MKIFLFRFLLVGPIFLAQALWGQEEPSSKLTIQAQTNNYNTNGEQVSKGLVRIQYGSLFLMTADECVVNTKKRTLNAIGNVKMDLTTQEGLVEVSAQEVFFDIERESGYLLEVSASFGDELFFVGQVLEILQSGNLILIEKGVLTACNQPTPHWSMRIQSATVKKEGYAVIRGAKFMVKATPVLLVPYAILPAMQNRRSGILQPDTGRSERNGNFLSLPFYWAPRQDMDVTLTPTYFETAGLRLDFEARYHPRVDLVGNLSGSYFTDKVIKRAGSNAPIEDGKPLDANRFRLHWDHDQPLKNGHIGVRIEEGSDFSVDRDFLQNASSTRLRDYFSKVRLDKNFGYDNLSLEVNQLRRIMVNEDEVVGVTRLPSLRFYQVERPVGAGFYYRGQVHLDRFDLEDLGPFKLNENILRYGVESEISRPLSLGRWFHARYGANARTAIYDRESVDGNEPIADGEVTRLSAFFDVAGPKLRKKYGRPDQQKLHEMDLGLLFRYGNEDEDPFLEKIRLDELDTRLFLPGKGLVSAWRMNSRLFQGPGKSFRPLMELEIRQEIRVEDSQDEPTNGPIETRWRLFNLSGFYANGVFDYNPSSGDLETLTLYTSVNHGNWNGYGGYVRRSSEGAGADETFIGISDFKLPRWRSRLRFSLDYDIAEGVVKSQELLYGYQGQCVGFAVNYVRSPFDSSRQGQKDFFQFTLTLRNLSELGTKF